MTTHTLYRAEGLDPLIAISDDGPLIETLGQVMLGWNIAPVAGRDAESGAAPAIRVERVEKGWTCSGGTFDKPVTYADPVATACALIAHLYSTHTLADREGLILHAAGVRIGAGLVVLTGHYRAGKTVVATACAAAGMQVFSDDIIPLDRTGRIARAPGLAIRLRLPLPDNLAADTRAFVETHQIAASGRYAYIRPPRDRLAVHDETAPISGVVALRRTEDGSPRLSRLAPGDALSEAIRRNFAREVPASAILDAFDGLLASVPCLSLTYQRAEDAAALLRDAFQGALPEIAEDAPAAAPARRSRRRADRLDDAAILHRSHGAHARERDGQTFLTDAEELVIYNLNATGTAVWRVLEQPTAFGDLTAMFSTGFPDRDPAAIAADLSRLIRDLAANGLVQIGKE